MMVPQPQGHPASAAAAAAAPFIAASQASHYQTQQQQQPQQPQQHLQYVTSPAGQPPQGMYTYAIPPGAAVGVAPGHPPLGALGYVDCAVELLGQLDDAGRF